MGLDINLRLWALRYPLVIAPPFLNPLNQNQLLGEINDQN